MPLNVESLPVRQLPPLPDSEPLEHAAAPRAFGWPAVVLLLGLVIATFGFSFALRMTGADPKSAVVVPLLLLFGAGLLVVPVASTRVRTRLGAAARGAFDGVREKK